MTPEKVGWAVVGAEEAAVRQSADRKRVSPLWDCSLPTDAGE